jgi:hypothetical protein
MNSNRQSEKNIHVSVISSQVWACLTSLLVAIFKSRFVWQHVDNLILKSRSNLFRKDLISKRKIYIISLVVGRLSGRFDITKLTFRNHLEGTKLIMTCM